MNKRFITQNSLPVSLRHEVHKRLARAVIDFALEDLQSPSTKWNTSASRFFSSDWFVYLCAIIQMDSKTIRRHVKQSPGYVTQSRRRKLAADPRAAARSKHKKLLSRRTKLIAISPDGKAVTVNGYTYAAQLVGCTAPAIYYAVRKNRKCLGWTFLLNGSQRGGV